MSERSSALRSSADRAGQVWPHVRWGAGACTAVFAMVFFAVSAVPAVAQTSDAQAATISALVLGDLNVIVENDLSFGDVVINSGEHAVQLLDDDAGQFRVNGAGQSEVILTIAERPTVLVRDGGGEIPFTEGLHVWYNGGVGNHNSNDPCPPQEAVEFTGPTEVVELRCNQDGSPPAQGGRGEAFVWFFGTIDVGDVDPGDYAAQITLEAEYN